MYFYIIFQFKEDSQGVEKEEMFPHEKVCRQTVALHIH